MAPCGSKPLSIKSNSRFISSVGLWKRVPPNDTRSCSCQLSPLRAWPAVPGGTMPGHRSSGGAGVRKLTVFENPDAMLLVVSVAIARQKYIVLNARSEVGVNDVCVAPSEMPVAVNRMLLKFESLAISNRY